MITLSPLGGGEVEQSLLPRPAAVGDFLWVHSASVVRLPKEGDVTGTLVPASKLFGGDPLDANGFVCTGWQGYSIPVGTVSVQTDAVCVRLGPCRPTGLLIGTQRDPTAFLAPGDKQQFGPFFTGKGGTASFNAGVGVFTMTVVNTLTGLTVASVGPAVSGSATIPAGILATVVLEIDPASVPFVGQVLTVVGVSD